MAIACAEANAALISKLRSNFGSVVTIRGSPAILFDGAHSPSSAAASKGSESISTTIYLVTLDSPLISEDTPHVEIVVERDGLRFKPWREV